MHELSIPADLVDRVTTRTGRAHPFDVIEPAKTAFVVVDMQNYFMKPGFQGEVPKARAIVPAVNRLAAAVRELGGHVVWIKNATNAKAGACFTTGCTRRSAATAATPPWTSRTKDTRSGPSSMLNPRTRKS